MMSFLFPDRKASETMNWELKTDELENDELMNWNLMNLKLMNWVVTALEN